MRQPRVDFTTKNAFCFGLLLAFNVYGVALIGNNNFSNHSHSFLMIFKGFVDLSPTSYHQVNETSGLNPEFCFYTTRWRPYFTCGKSEFPSFSLTYAALIHTSCAQLLHHNNIMNKQAQLWRILTSYILYQEKIALTRKAFTLPCWQHWGGQQASTCTCHMVDGGRLQYVGWGTVMFALRQIVQEVLQLLALSKPQW